MTMTAIEAPEPCPFCGGTTLRVETYSVQPDDYHSGYVTCWDCETEGPRPDTWLDNKAEAKSAAIQMWNRRAALTAETRWVALEWQDNQLLINDIAAGYVGEIYAQDGPKAPITMTKWVVGDRVGFSHSLKNEIYDSVEAARAALETAAKQWLRIPTQPNVTELVESLKAEIDVWKGLAVGNMINVSMFDRDRLGREVREAWVKWAQTQPNPKPSWLAPYDDLSEPDKEADRQIGEHIAAYVKHVSAVSSQPNVTELVEAHKQGVYVASRASNPRRPAMWRAYRDGGAPIISTWIDEAGEGETADISELWQRIDTEIASAAALILYVEAEDFPLKGAFIEVGMAIARGLPIYVVAPDVRLEPRSLRPLGSWAAHPSVTFCATVSEALSRAKGG